MKFVLKEIPSKSFTIRSGIYERLGSSPYVRGLEDVVPEHSIFVFKYLNQNLLQMVSSDIPVATIKTVLKHSLQGIAAMHAKDIVHTGMKQKPLRCLSA